MEMLNTATKSSLHKKGENVLLSIYPVLMITTPNKIQTKSGQITYMSEFALDIVSLLRTRREPKG